MAFGLGDKKFWFQDASCMTFVFARAPARAVAETLGSPVLLWRDGERLDAQLDDSAMGLVAKMSDSDWAVVQLYDLHPGVPSEYCSYSGEEVADEEYDICLEGQDEAAWMQIIPDGVPRRAAPVTTAARISDQLRTQAVGIWGSDEIIAAGAAFFDSGMYSRVYSLYGPPDEEMDYGVLNEAGTTVIRPSGADTDPTGIFDLIDNYMAELQIAVPADSWMSPDYAETLVGMAEVWGVSWRG